MRKMEGLQWTSLEPSDDKAKSSVKQFQQEQATGGIHVLPWCQPVIVIWNTRLAHYASLTCLMILLTLLHTFL